MKRPTKSVLICVGIALAAPASASAQLPVLGGKCASSQWGQQLGVLTCARAGKSKFILVALPQPVSGSTQSTLATPQGLIAQPAGPSSSTLPPAAPPVTTTPPITAAPPVATVLPTTTPLQPTPVTAPPTIATAPPAPTPAPSGAKRYANCTELNVDYPHGVGRPGAIDKSSTGNLVTNFEQNVAVYEANKGSDRDGDGIACEK